MWVRNPSSILTALGEDGFFIRSCPIEGGIAPFQRDVLPKLFISLPRRSALQEEDTYKENAKPDAFGLGVTVLS